MSRLQIASHDVGLSLRQFQRYAEQGLIPGLTRTKGGHLRLLGPWTPARAKRLKALLPLRRKTPAPKKQIPPTRSNAGIRGALPTRKLTKRQEAQQEAIKMAQKEIKMLKGRLKKAKTSDEKSQIRELIAEWETAGDGW